MLSHVYIGLALFVGEGRGCVMLPEEPTLALDITESAYLYIPRVQTMSVLSQTWHVAVK